MTKTKLRQRRARLVRRLKAIRERWIIDVQRLAAAVTSTTLDEFFESVKTIEAEDKRKRVQAWQGYREGR